VEEGSEALAARLTARGLEAIADGRAVLIALTDERPYDIVRDTVVDLGLALVRIEQRRHKLEDLFRDEPDSSPMALPPTASPPAAVPPVPGPER
jgi:ABC-2 type transport system ATP-binding protein